MPSKCNYLDLHLQTVLQTISEIQYTRNFVKIDLPQIHRMCCYKHLAGMKVHSPFKNSPHVPNDLNNKRILLCKYDN